MYVVTTLPSFKKIHRRKREKITVSFAFCAHVDVIKIEKRCMMFAFERARAE